MKKRLFSLTLALLLTIAAVPVAVAADTTAEDTAPMAEIDTQRVGGGGMGNAVGIYDYPQYFDEKGVFGVVEAGNFYINDFQVPANAEELAALGEAGFVVNSGATALTAKDGKFLVDGKKEFTEYADAIKALVNDELPGGLHIDLYDTNGDEKADIVKLWYTEGLIVNGISRDADGNYILYRGDLERVPTHAGRLYDAENFGGILGEVIKPENFDTSLKEGDGAVFYLTPDGWIVKKAVEANGILVDGVDHDFYQIDDVKYTDTMKYSRDNLIVAQRNGEFANAHTYFGFKNNEKGIKVSMWMDPYSMSPIGITSNENAKVFLADAIAQSKAKLASVTLTDAATAEQKFAYAALEEAIKLAEETLADEDSYNSELDFYVYYLYLAQAGTGKDIGAAFSGFFTNAEFGWERMNAYPGFDALFAEKEPDPEPAPEPEPEPAPAETYTVVAGDCLWKIAARVYGSGTQFGRIAEANGIKAPYTIYIGQVLTIPAK
ncbi:MAG: LysM peptidoglycan-binding domain-containing protein [Oscillospiraceae bacterium]